VCILLSFKELLLGCLCNRMDKLIQGLNFSKSAAYKRLIEGLDFLVYNTHSVAAAPPPREVRVEQSFQTGIVTKYTSREDKDLNRGHKSLVVRVPGIGARGR